jgi:hypothetical protein
MDTAVLDSRSATVADALSLLRRQRGRNLDHQRYPQRRVFSWTRIGFFLGTVEAVYDIIRAKGREPVVALS